MIPGGSQEDVLAESVLKGKSEGAKGRMDKACQAEGAGHLEARRADAENRHVDTGGRERLGQTRRVLSTYTHYHGYNRTSQVAQTVQNLPAMQETGVRSLGQEDTLQKGKVIHSRIPAWEISWTEDPGGLRSMGSQRVGHD